VKDVSVVLIGKDYWEDLINWKKFVEFGLISPKDLSLFHFAETATEAWKIIMREHQQGNSS
jgi:predicted Rossmann-fold nucleotide-binding protein